MDYSIYDYNSDEKLLQEQEIEEINNVKMSLLNTLVTKLNNAGIYLTVHRESSQNHHFCTSWRLVNTPCRKVEERFRIS